MRYLLSMKNVNWEKVAEVSKKRLATPGVVKSWPDGFVNEKGILPWHFVLGENLGVAVVDIEDPNVVQKWVEDFSAAGEVSAKPFINLQEYRKKFPSQ